MAYGYERGFVIEKDDTRRKTVNCRDCEYYFAEDKSCAKTSLYFPVDGYKHWKRCKYFILDRNTSNYYEKKKAVEKLRGI